MATPKNLREAGPALRRTAGAVRPHLRPQRKVIAGGLLAMFLEVGFRLLEPWPVKVVVDAVVADGATLSASMVGLLVAMGLAVVGAAVGRAVCNYAATISFALAGSRAATAIRAQVFDRVQELSIRQHAKLRTGDLVQRLVGDVGRLQEVAITAGLPLLGNLLTFVAMIGVMVWLDAPLAAIGVAAAVLFVLMSRRRTGRITSAARKTRRREGELATQVAETVGALPTVQAFGLEGVLRRHFAGSNQKSLKEGVKARRLAAALERRTDVVVALAVALVLGFGGWRVVAGAVSPGELVVFLTYLKSAMKPLRDVAKYTGRIAKAAAAGERVVDLLDTEPEVRDRPNAITPPVLRGSIRFENVHLAYEPGRWALSGVDLEVAPGEQIALIGPSGGGKSTIAGLLQRLLDPTRGTLRFDGYDVTRLKLADVRAQVAVVPQEPVLFATSVRENLRYGRADATDDQIEAAARAANAHEFVTQLPDGYDTVIGERGASLSGGQRQRIALARALLRDAPIVVLDEATAAVDPDNETAIREAIARVTAGRTTILITHDHDALDDVDHIYWVMDGKVERLPAPPSDLTALTGAAPPDDATPREGRDHG